ncbi:MAG: hypothetical protein ACI9N9_002110 [Enterobacterales bacterium]|jgi:hypothetical protein
MLTGMQNLSQVSLITSPFPSKSFDLSSLLTRLLIYTYLYLFILIYTYLYLFDMVIDIAQSYEDYSYFTTDILFLIPMFC